MAVIPFHNGLAQVIAVPESAIKDTCQAFVPFVKVFKENFLALIGIGERIDSFAIATHNSINVFWPACTAFYLENAYTGLKHLVKETDGLQVAGRHDVFIFDVEFCACLYILYCITTAAELHALTAIGGASPIALAQVAFAADGHAECSMAEHFYAYGVATWSADVFFFDSMVNFCHLFHVQFAGQYHDIGKLSIEAQSLHIADVQLGA